MATDPTANPPVPTEPPPVGEIRIPSSDEERTMGLIAHLGGVATTFVAPLILWQVKKDQSRFIADQAKEALNFQLNALGYYFVCAIFSVITCGYGIVSFFPVVLYVAIIGIIGGLKANNGEVFRYPGTVRLVK